MRYAVRLSQEVQTYFQHLSPVPKRKIKESLRGLSLNPYLGKPLVEPLLGLFSYRVVNMRIIYMMHEKKCELQVVVIGLRKTIYENLEKYVLQKR
ncbi:MAG: type II toxin-antitoxin system mRNA interferase toxin, RelE/StbE family [Deltaproteobacteria bacterium]|nr:type II toxin-antitoxin system mRNA interferase toxin, RelE/StbE family [Deltaproteobacteria bacterium]